MSSPREVVMVVSVDRAGMPTQIEAYESLEGYLQGLLWVEVLGPFDGWADVAKGLLRASRGPLPVPLR